MPGHQACMQLSRYLNITTVCSNNRALHTFLLQALLISLHLYDLFVAITEMHRLMFRLRQGWLMHISSTVYISCCKEILQL